MKQIKIGIFGVGPRGLSLSKDLLLLGCDIVAVCDKRPSQLALAQKQLGKDVALYADFDAFLAHGFDAVLLTNFFHEHAPYAIKCFEKGIHVFSECISNGTMAEGVALVRAYEKSSCIYMLGENYPQMLFNREIKRICDTGSLGKILYAEGEYNHPGDPMNLDFGHEYNYFSKHWRNYLPRTYYVTHSLGPIMWATGATPVRVMALAAFAPVLGDTIPRASHVGDAAAIICTQNDDGSIFRFTGCAAFGGHHNAYRVCGTEGQIENLRGMKDKVMLRYNAWSKPEGAEEVSLYTPSWHDRDEGLITASGHGGGDYLTMRNFIDCVREGRQPEHPFDLYSAVAMSSVAILGHRSVLEGGRPYDIPNFRKEEQRRAYEADTLSPFYGGDGTAPTLPCCTKTDFAPSKEQLALYLKEFGE